MKPKIVKAWAFSVRQQQGYLTPTARTRREIRRIRRSWTHYRIPVGPIVRIKVPAPVEARKEQSKR